jgi:hypothetical protein
VSDRLFAAGTEGFGHERAGVDQAHRKRDGGRQQKWS